MKKFLMFVLAFVFLFTAVACASERGSDEPINVDIDKNTEATIKVAILSDSGEEMMFKSAIEQFNKTYPNITVKLEKVSSYEQKIMSMINSGESYDVLHTPDNMVSYFAAEEILVNLEPYIKAQGFDRSLYFDSMIKLGQNNFNGDQYMLPREYSKIVTYWNKGLFDQYNITKRPTEDWTWEDFLAVCKEAKEKMPSNYIALDASMEYAILNYAILASNGVDTYLNEDHKLIEDTSKIAAGMEMANEVVSNGYCFKPEIYSKGDFFRKTAAMTFDVRPAFSNYADPSMANDFEVVPFPSIGDDPKIPAGTSGFGIYTGSKNKNVAWAFINFIMSEEGQLTLSKTGNIVPILKSLAEDPNAEWRKLKNGVGREINNDVFIMHSDRDVVSKYFGNIPGASFPLFRSSWSDFCSDILNGRKTIAVALNNLRVSIEGIHKSYPEYFA